MAKIQVFLDTDVIISSVLSQTGASFKLINISKVKKVISIDIAVEIAQVTKRLNIKSDKPNAILRNVKIANLSLFSQEVLKKYNDYVYDLNDSHVIAGAHLSKSRYLITHNIKHYKVNQIKDDFGIVVARPGNLLQYLRSINLYK